MAIAAPLSSRYSSQVVERSVAEKAQNTGDLAPWTRGNGEEASTRESARAHPVPARSLNDLYQGFAAQWTTPGPGPQLGLWWPSLYMAWQGIS